MDRDSWVRVNPSIADFGEVGPGTGSNFLLEHLHVQSVILKNFIFLVLIDNLFKDNLSMRKFQSFEAISHGFDLL